MAEKRLERLFIEPEYLWTPAYRHAIRQNETATLTMLLDLPGALTGEQKQHVLTALDSLKKDLVSLSKE